MRNLRGQLAFLAAVSLCVPLSIPASASETPESSSAPIIDPSIDPNILNPETLDIPGPLRSLLRMSGISQKVPPESVLPLLARSVYFLGYRQGNPTEFLVLLQRYIHQARELEVLAGPQYEIRVQSCAEAGPLLEVLGYSLHNACGHPDASLVTSNAERAFITVDSGFPLTRLEESLQTGTPFVYPYAPSKVPLLLRRTDWTNAGRTRKFATQDFLDLITRDPEVARLYWAFSKLDPETAFALQSSAGLPALIPYAAVMDFYGSQLCIRSRKVMVPGGAAAEPGWKELVGASPRSPGEFALRLLERDRGWLALYYDTLARVGAAQQAQLTQGPRLRRLYDAFVKSGPDGDAAGAAFRKAPGLLVLFARQRWLADGAPRIPGDLDMWRLLLGKRAPHLSTGEQLLEAMVSKSSVETDSGPLQIYLTLSALDDARSAEKQASPSTLLLMASNYREYSSWYSIFSEFPELSDASILRFIHTADSVNRIANQDLRGDALGTLQANLCLWQILARQGEVPKPQIDSSWQQALAPFDNIGSPVIGSPVIGSQAQLLDAGEKSLSSLMLAAAGNAQPSQDELIELLAGPPQKSAGAVRVRGEIADRMRLAMDDQRLTSLDTLLELSKGLSAMAHGAPRSDRLVALAGSLREFELPRPIFTENERYQWAPDMIRQRHAQLQAHTDLVKIVQQPQPPAKLEAARGQLAPFLRDTLVGLVYAYYEPPGSQVLHINPMFVRSHDFAGVTIIGEEHLWQTASLFGTGASAGGGAYLVGSLSDLPYVLAATEQDLISPANVQALIWQQLVPSLLAGATLARWWNATPKELHAVALYQQEGEQLVAAAAANPELLDKITPILSDRLPPQRLWQVEWALRQKRPDDALSRLTPSDTFGLAVEFRRQFPAQSAATGSAGRAIEKLIAESPSEVGLDRISRDFGSPHPTLEQTYGRDLVNGQPFPAFSGSANRLFGESWDSNNLYWARLADEKNDAPETLNVLSPQLTRLMIAKIFATDVEDWAAIGRAMHEAGADLQQGKVANLRGADNGVQP
jgi:hypothetical protein